MRYLLSNLPLTLGEEALDLAKALAHALGGAASGYRAVTLERRSLDARHKGAIRFLTAISFESDLPLDLGPMPGGLKLESAPLAARIRFPNHKHASLTLEKLTDFIRAQVPHFGDFRNGIMPLDVHRGLDLGWYGHCGLVTPIGSRRSSNWLVGFRESCGKDSSCFQSPIELR